MAFFRQHRAYGIQNDDPHWLTITDFNLNEYGAGQHVVQEWQKHCKYLELWLPSDEELRRRWWRSMLIAFVQRNLKKRGLPKHSFYEWGKEDYIIEQRYPWLRDLWVRQRVRLTAFLPPIEVLRKRWWYGKRHDMCMRWIGGRVRYIPPRFRFGWFLASLVWCRHKECWKLRTNVVFNLCLILFLLYLIIYL